MHPVNPVTVEIHCKPYIRHWLQRQYGNTVVFPPRSEERLHFVNSLCKTFRPSADYNKTLYPDSVRVAVSQDDITTHGHSISIKMQQHINRYLQHRMELELFMFVVAQRMKGHSINAAVRDYLALHQFTPDLLSFDAAEKKYDRFVNRLQNKIFGASVPVNTTHRHAASLP